MSKVNWIESPTATDQSCIACGNRQGNTIILNATHWHADYGRIEVARCDQCQSAFTLNADNTIIPYPATETALRDPNFIYLIYHYIELASGLDWKLPLIERLPFHRFNAVLEIGCNVGVTLDYCQTAWDIDAVGLEPSAYGVKGAQILDLQILNAYSHEADDLRGRQFSFIYATEVLEHVADPLAFLKEMRTYLEPGGILLITTPCSSALHKDTLPGELYAVLSAGAHYFLLSQKQLERLALEAGFKYVDINLLYQTNIAYMSDRPIPFQGDPMVEPRLAAYHAEKITQHAKHDDRLHLSHLIGYYIYAIKSNTPFDEKGLSNEIDEALIRQFKFSLDEPLALAQRIVQTASIFDIGKTIPYSLPAYLYHRAEYLRNRGASPGACYELAALIGAKGLQNDFQNLFIYSHVFRLSQQRLKTRPTRSPETEQTRLELRHIIDTVTAAIPELNETPLSANARIKRKLRVLRNWWCNN